MIATLGALLLTTLIAQAPTPTPSASAAEPLAPTGTTGPSLPGTTPPAIVVPAAPASDILIRRGPHTTPRMNGPRATPEDITIVNSGSTNAAGYTIVVHPDGSADVVVNGTAERKMVGRAQVRWLYAKVRAAAPFAPHSSAGCMKSMSFGTSTTIAYEGSRSPDLSCEDDATATELLRTANVIATQLEIPALRARGVPARPLP